MANMHFLRKLACDELYDTLFFATGEVPVKTKSPEHIIMRSADLSIKVVHPRKIYVNGDLCKSTREAKYAVCDIISV